MGRSLQPCGTHAAYVRHRRSGEDCEVCRAAESERRAKARAEKRRAAASVSQSEDFVGASVGVEQKFHADQDAVVLQVPSGFDPVESAKWRLAKIRGAMLLSTPRDMASLVKAEAEEVARLNELVGGAVEKKVSALDELAKRRAERIARASG